VKPQTKQILTQWRATGYKVGPVVHQSDRNRGYRLEREGQPFFGKLTVTRQTIEMENDAWWALTMARLTGDSAETPIRAPRIHETGPGWLICEWFDTPLLLPHDFNHGEAKIAPHAKRLADSLAWLDGLWRAATTTRVYDSTNSAPYVDLMRKVDSWLEQPLAHGTVTAAASTAAKQLISDYLPHVHPAFQHGDFVPWQLFTLSDRQFCLFDGEHASLVKPRYYDLAYLYSRLYTRSAAPQAARDILKRYLAQSGANPTEFHQAFLPVITLRALGIQADAWADRQHFDYYDRAADLLARCLTRDPAALITA
jgi:hypothetical protein